MIRMSQSGQPDELEVAKQFIDAYKSQNLKVIRSLKGQSDDTNSQLAGDVDAEGKLVNPSRWGLLTDGDASNHQPCGAEPPKKRGRGKPSMEDEEKFWEEVKQADFQVPTDGRLGRIASRWNRAIKDPELKKKYDSTTQAVGQSMDEAKRQFRVDWAKDEYKAFLKEKSITTTSSRSTFTNMAVKYVSKALVMGAPWVLWDEMTESVRVLYVTKGINQVFTVAWQQHEKWTNEETQG
ncbi:unnamed protein product [Prorocentrum cordatum]|uniref:Uncharacterized protein n=1 Tax=Prorocentrum cordatum TaxID=2364126 RepID=A0ABN9T2S0_9DINO|nr:unnamed protein product [Polarella glacialis]